MNCEKCGKEMEARVNDVKLDKAQGLAVLVKFDVGFHCPTCNYTAFASRYKAFELEKG